MMGASKRVCQTSGQWSGNTPECKHSARLVNFLVQYGRTYASLYEIKSIDQL